MGMEQYYEAWKKSGAEFLAHREGNEDELWAERELMKDDFEMWVTNYHQDTDLKSSISEPEQIQ